jgi:hypothetical protein
MTIAGLRQVTPKQSITGAGDTDILDLGRGVHCLYVQSESWVGKTAALMLVRDSVEYVAEDTAGNPIAFTSNRVVPILGGQKYFLRVTGGTGVLVADAVQAAREI